MSDSAPTRTDTSTAPQATAPSDRVPLRQKIAYGLGTVPDMWGHYMYQGLANQLFVVYLGMSPGRLGDALALTKLVDAVSDPLFGWISDNTRTRFGRRRPFILAGTLLAGLCMPLLFLVQPGWTESKYFWFIVCTLSLYIPMMSCFYLPWQSLGAEMTPDYHERTSVAAYRMFMQRLPEVMFGIAIQFAAIGVWVGASYSNVLQKTWEAVTSASLTRFFTELSFWEISAEAKPNIIVGTQVVATVLGLGIVASGLFMFFVLRERYYDNVQKRQQEKVRLREILWEPLLCKPYRMQLLMTLAFNLGTGVINAMAYYVSVYYVCRGSLAEANRWGTPGMMIYVIVGMASVPLINWMAHRMGKLAAARLILAIGVVGFTSSWWLMDPDRPGLMLAGGVISSFVLAGFWMLLGAVAADVIDYDELQCGKRREGAFSSCASWLFKAAGVLSLWLWTHSVDWLGFDAKLGANQPESTIFWMRVLLIVFPVAGSLIAIWGLTVFPLTPSKMAEIRAQLEARRGKV